MIALDERLHALKEGQPERVALIELFTALAAKASEVSRIIAAGGDLGSAIGNPYFIGYFSRRNGRILI